MTRPFIRLFYEVFERRPQRKKSTAATLMRDNMRMYGLNDIGPEADNYYRARVLSRRRDQKRAARKETTNDISNGFLR
jgi:hypothetical protein